MVRVALAALVLSSCTIIGVSAGAITATSTNHDGDAGRDMVIGGAIGAVIDLSIYGIYRFVQSNITVPK